MRVHQVVSVQLPNGPNDWNILQLWVHFKELLKNLQFIVVMPFSVILEISLRVLTHRVLFVHSEYLIARDSFLHPALNEIDVSFFA